MREFHPSHGYLSEKEYADAVNAPAGGADEFKRKTSLRLRAARAAATRAKRKAATSEVTA